MMCICRSVRIITWLNNSRKRCRNIFSFFLHKGFILYVVFLILLLASWGAEMREGKSLLEFFYPNRICPVFLRAPAILEAIKVVGLSNILIGWIYKSLDMQMLGLSYGELIRYQYHSYHTCSIAHICATICCILAASAGTSESAIIALLAVLYGFFYQGCILYRIVLNPNACEQIAVDRWKGKIQQTNASSCIITLAGTIPTPESEHYQAHLLCFARAFAKYCAQVVSEANIREVSYFWHTLLSIEKQQDPISTVAAVANSFWNGEMGDYSDEQRKKFVNILLAGYLVYLFTIAPQGDGLTPLDFGKDNAVSQNSREFAHLSSNILLLSKHLSNCSTSDHMQISNDVINCMKTNCCVMAWVYFQFGAIELTPEMLKLMPSDLDCSMVKDVAYSIVQPVDDIMREDLDLTIQRSLAQCQCRC